MTNDDFWVLLDTSQLSTFCVAILLVVYGSFRSLNLEHDSKQHEKDKELDSIRVQTLDSSQALFLPIGSSISLLIMFFFFDSLQTVFAMITAVIATMSFAFLLLPLCHYLLRPCSYGSRISLALFGRYCLADLLAFGVSFVLVFLWVLTGHWMIMDALGMGLCVAFIAFVRLPSLKVSTMLLTGLLVYDIFWVFLSPYFFSVNVMLSVATRSAENPLNVLAKKFQMLGLLNDQPSRLSLPGKLVFPSVQSNGHSTMLGLGDVVMPGLLLCFVMRYDAHKRAQSAQELATPLPSQMSHLHKITYFHCTLIGYFMGLLTATLSAEVFRAAQPALLYLVPFTLLPLLIIAYLKGDLWRMWLDPFASIVPTKYQLI